ncbi:unnamed protein product, partial [Ectocarpus sp. 12 AP-2014]
GAGGVDGRQRRRPIGGVPQGRTDRRRPEPGVQAAGRRRKARAFQGRALPVAGVGADLAGVERGGHGDGHGLRRSRVGADEILRVAVDAPPRHPQGVQEQEVPLLAGGGGVRQASRGHPQRRRGTPRRLPSPRHYR